MVAAVTGIGDHHLDLLDKTAPQRRPLLGGMQRMADGRGPMVLLDHLTVVDALDQHPIRCAAGQRRRACSTGRAVGALHHGNPAQGSAALQGLGHEQIHVSLKKAAGAELQDRR